MVRLSAQTVQNVVTYTAVISVENRDQALLPGMTANLQIVTDERENVLRVPNAASALPACGRSRPACHGKRCGGRAQSPATGPGPGCAASHRARAARAGSIASARTVIRNRLRCVSG